MQDTVLRTLIALGNSVLENEDERRRWARELHDETLHATSSA